MFMAAAIELAIRFAFASPAQHIAAKARTFAGHTGIEFRAALHNPHAFFAAILGLVALPMRREEASASSAGTRLRTILGVGNAAFDARPGRLVDGAFGDRSRSHHLPLQSAVL